MFRKPKRVPRRVGRDDDEELQSRHGTGVDSESPVVIKRPTKSKAVKAKPRTPVTHSNEYTETRTTYDVGEDDDPFTIIERKRAAASSQKSRLSPNNLPYRSQSYGRAPDAPRYTSDYIASLKAEQISAPPPDAQVVQEGDLPPTPPDTSAQDADLDGIGFIDTGPSYGAATVIPSKPTSSSALIKDDQQSYIPSATEIAAKKARRARLAAEGRAEDFIKLDDEDAASSSDEANANDSLIIKAEERASKDKYGRDESRLGEFQLDDDDFAEGFDDFVDDPGKITTTVDGRKQARQKRREEIRKHLADAESEGADDDVDADEASRMRAYDQVQIRNATYGSRTTVHGREHRQREKDREREEAWRRQLEMRYVVRPVPRIGDVVRRLNEKVEETKRERERLEERAEAVRREKEDIAVEEVRVQDLLREAGEKLERVLKVEGDGTKKEKEREAEEEKKEDGGKEEMEIEDEPPIAGDASDEGQKEEEDKDTGGDDEDDEDDDAVSFRPGLGAGMGLGAR